MKTQRGQLIAHDSAHGLQILSKDACIPNAPSTSRRSPTTSAARRPARIQFASATILAARRPAQLRLATSAARRPAQLRSSRPRRPRQPHAPHGHNTRPRRLTRQPARPRRRALAALATPLARPATTICNQAPVHALACKYMCSLAYVHTY